MSITVTKLSYSNNILSGSASVLVPSRDMVRNFGADGDFVEMHVSDPAGKHLYSVVPFTNYKVPGLFQPTDAYSIQELEFNPDIDIKNLGIQFGDYRIQYNILRPKVVLGTNDRPFFLKEISPNRLELRLSTNNITNSQIEQGVIGVINEIQSVNYFKEYYLNFGNNNLVPFVNIALDKSTSIYSVVIKLLNPLPQFGYNINSSLSIVDEISNPQVFNVEITLDTIPVTFPTLRGPNFDLDLDQLRVGPTPYYNFNQVTSYTGQFAPQLQQLLGQLSASNFSINVDYTNYEDFIHFSSAARRLEGFRYKLINIEATSSLSASAASSASPTSNIDAENYQNNINKIIQSFDGWEQYLYFQSESAAWPKQNNTKPYIVQSVTASEAASWFTGNYDSASIYDENNQNYLLYTLPGYIAENENNELAFEFVASIGQMFDDVWIHIKAISDLYQAKNALDQGISKDLVYFALQSMGINTYTDEDGESAFKYLYGIDENGNYLPNTGSLETLVTASQYQIPGQDQQKEIYKRLYHNLPLLLKSKGTNRFIQYLNTIFGIPNTIMGYIEYGGVDKVTSSFEYEYDRFTYGMNTFDQGVVEIPWVFLSQSLNRTGYNDIAPDGFEFRFKAFATSSNEMKINYDVQTLAGFSDDVTSYMNLDLIYTQTGSSDSIYSGSTGEFGYISFTINTFNVTSSTVPIFTTGSDGETSWYNLLVQRRYPNRRVGQLNDQQYYDLYVKNNVYGEIGHVASASLYIDGTISSDNEFWYGAVANSKLHLGNVPPLSSPFSGSFQEFRMWSNYISESAFDSHVLNPESIEGNFTTSSFDDLAVRFTLGNNLYTYNHSVTTELYSTHPDQTTQILTASFIDFLNTNAYNSFTETYYADAANSGYANPVTDKVRIVSGSTYGNQLLPYKSIEITPIIPLTKDLHLLDASLSPQDEIDRNIIAQFGSTYNLDDIIGNPATGSYQQLQVLQYDFFKKFDNKYNYKDYIRLISFFHNSLFRTLKDFTPARTNLSTGIVIKPHLLERPVIQRYEPTITHLEYSQSIDTAFISSSNGGNYSQSLYSDTIHSNMGPVTMTSDARDFFTGVFPSASVIAYSNEFQEDPFLSFNPYNTSSYSESIFRYDYDPLINNVSSSITSSIRHKITYITSGSKLVQVFEPIELQDFTYEYLRHARPRYIGSQVNSDTYNFLTNNDQFFDLDGIGSYGKNAAIDKNTLQFAYFSEATCTGSFQIAMPERSNLYIKYLIDSSSSLTELAQRDYTTITSNQFYNLYQVQNIFKAGEELNISLFNNQIPSLQKTLDGNQFIYSSGYKYYPVLWRVAETDQIYYIPSGSNPLSGVLSVNSYAPSNTAVNYSTRFLSTTTIITGRINYSPAILLPYDVIVTVKIDLDATGGNIFRGDKTETFDVLIPAFGVNGSPNFIGSYRRDVQGRYNIKSGFPRVINVFPAAGTATDFKYKSADDAAYLTVNNIDKSVISCSLQMTSFYNAGLYFSGSVTQSQQPDVISTLNIYNSFAPPDYSFTLTPGDVVRFNYTGSNFPTTRFRSVDEYTVLEANTTGSPITFRLDREVNDNITSSVTPYRIERYVFSKKIPDETNIIVEHEKNPGLTSGGVAKNKNLLMSVDDQVGNIVSELKSKIFSTVLTN